MRVYFLQSVVGERKRGSLKCVFVLRVQYRTRMRWTHRENEAVVQFLLLPGALPVVLEVAPLEAREQAHHLIHARDVALPQFPGEGKIVREGWHVSKKVREG